MRYRLNELAAIAADIGLSASRVDANRLDVVLHDGCRLVFCNDVGDVDTLIGFEGTPWHSHGLVQFLTGNSTYVEVDELELLRGLASGELVVVSQYLAEELRDRWIAHREEPLDVGTIQPGEELRIWRLAMPPTRIPPELQHRPLAS